LIVAFLYRINVIQDDEYENHNQAQMIQDILLCLEMPLFAWMHWYAFPWTDYDDKRLSSRLLFPFAVRDALGIKDIVFDTKLTFANLFTQSLSGNFGDQDEIEPILHSTVNYGDSIEFSLDPTEEVEYRKSRNLVFGDFHYPVFHQDWRNPPAVQAAVDSFTESFYRDIQGRPLTVQPVTSGDDE
jgi:hypothetical protein